MLSTDTDLDLPQTDTADPGPGIEPATLDTGSVTARTLYQVWSGHSRVVVVNSPPGAGKTTLIAKVVAHLTGRAPLSVTVVTNTRAQVLSVASRISRYLAPDRVTIAMSGVAEEQKPHPDMRVAAPMTVQASDQRVVVRTVASCQKMPPDTDVMIVDEAYQATFADIALAANNAVQLLMVGDPGQIGPVITCDTTVWRRDAMPPHYRAPEVFTRRRNGVTVLQLDTSWRLGPTTVAAIAPLYGFPFTSGRPDRRIGALPEIEQLPIAAVEDPAAPEVIGAVLDRVDDLIARTITDADGTRRVQPADVGIVVSHNAQASALTALLRGRGLEAVTVGTADRLQGGEWPAVIAVDPLTGYERVSTHALSLGRLCVMASRHTTHLSWVHDNQWVKLLDPDEPGAQTGREVREQLTASASPALPTT